MSYQMKWTIVCDQCGKMLLDAEQEFKNSAPPDWSKITLGTNPIIERHFCREHPICVDGKECDGSPADWVESL